jgi:two-component system LytT family sensor kinase
MTKIHTGAHQKRWLWIAAAWCAGALFDASQNVLIMRAEGRHHSWLPLFATELALWLPWALATPFIGRLARRWPLARGGMLRAAGVHLATFTVLALLTEAWSAVLQVTFNPWGNRRPPEFVNTLSTSLLYQVLTFLIVYALILTVAYAFESRQRMARQTIEAARLNEQLSKAQLAALRQQIEPHFMFNTLHAVAGLVREQRNEAAVSMIVGLSEFLRRASEDSNRAQVTLAEEVDYLQRYVDIQKARFGERLRFTIEIPEELLGARVPNLLLQPLVENAIKHGVSRRVAGGAVTVSGGSENGILRLRVYNDGPHPAPDWGTSRAGIGLENLRTRLKILHGDRAALDLRGVEAGGVEVVVTLPREEMHDAS